MKCCGPQYDLDPITRRKRTSRLSIGPYRRHELLTGWIVYPVEGYTGYGDGVGTDLTAFITDGMRADWEANRDELMEFWRSAHPDNFAYSLPWLFVRGTADTLPWAVTHLESSMSLSLSDDELLR